MKIKGIANWASVLIPNTKFDPVYCVDLTVTEEQSNELKGQGLKPKKNKDGEWVIKFKRKVMKNDGTYNDKPALVDSGRNPITCSVGNGSTVNVQYSVYEWSNSFGSGIGADFSGLQVLELVEYKGGDGDEFEEQDGFRSESPKEVVAPVTEAATGDVAFDDDIPF